jgi:hypothetical protein
MADYFIDVDMTTDELELADRAVARLQEYWPDWEPNDGDLEVVQIEALAQMAEDAALQASVMPAEAFDTILDALHDIERIPGTPATGTVTFALTDTDQHVIEIGTEIDVDGYVFIVDDDVTVQGSLTKAAVPVTASEVTLDSNALPGDQVAMITAVAFIASVSLDAPTAGAVEEEDDQAFRDRGSKLLELQAVTLVTGRDYELMALSGGVAGIDRVVAAANTATRTITVTASKADGTPLTSGVGSQKEALLALYTKYRQTTWTVTLGDPTLTTITATYSIHLYAGFAAADVFADVAARLADFLNPATWGTTPADPHTATTWAIEPRVRKNKVIDVIADAPGVDYVNDVTLTGSAGSVQSNGDWLMPGTVPLAKYGSSPGTVV